MTEAEMIGKIRTPAEHLAQAERLANAPLAAAETWRRTGISMTAADIAAYELYLHAAEVHLKLAEHKLSLG